MLKIILPSLMLLPLPLLYPSFSWLTSASSLFFLSTLSLILLFNMNSSLIFNEYLMNDFLASPLIILTMWITALMILASYPIFLKNQYPKTYLLFILMINLILILTFFASNFILFYLLFEATLIPTLFIILGWGYQPERLQAGFYLMIYTVTASLPLLINLILIFYFSYSLSFFNQFWNAPPISQIQNLWWLTMIAAFLVKMPMYSLHLWLPKAHVEAPVAGSMILAGLLLKLGSYGILRVSNMFLYMNKSLMPLILAISMWGAIITSMICIRQTDMKSLIAYSSVGHMGLLTAGTMTCSNWGWESSLLMMLAHGLCSSALFALANMTYETTQTRNIFLTKGMLTLFPIMTFLWFSAAVANFGAPPSLNLFAEMMLFTSILSSSTFTMSYIALSAFLAAVYSLFLYTSTQHGKPSIFSNPMHLFSSRNTLTITMHLFPVFFFCLKMDILINWL